MEDFHFRWFVRRDMPSVLECLARNGRAVTEDDLLPALRKRNTIGMVYVDSTHHVLGIVIYELHQQEIRCILWEDGQSPRCAERMASSLIDKLSKQRRTHLTIQVPSIEKAPTVANALRKNTEHEFSDFGVECDGDSVRFDYYIPSQGSVMSFFSDEDDILA